MEVVVLVIGGGCATGNAQIERLCLEGEWRHGGWANNGMIVVIERRRQRCRMMLEEEHGRGHWTDSGG